MVQRDDRECVEVDRALPGRCAFFAVSAAAGPREMLLATSEALAYQWHAASDGERLGLCPWADTNGCVTLSCRRPGPWDRFEVVQAEEGHTVWAGVS